MRLFFAPKTPSDDEKQIARGYSGYSVLLLAAAPLITAIFADTK
jgi:hypothetical protein